MTDEELARQCEQRAADERAAGGEIHINRGLPTVAVSLSSGSGYFCQGEEAEALLAEVPDWVNAEDYILASAQNW